jgi:hypothetical protein
MKKEKWVLASGLGCKIGPAFAACIFLFSACSDVPRDNVLDPKNPDSLRPAKILIEAFVNTNNPSLYNQYMLAALDSLSGLYSERSAVAEYHRNTEQYDDPYHLNENELLYRRYIGASGSSLKGVPDVFINGAEYRIQGCSSVHAALMRLQQAVFLELAANSLFTLEPACRVQNQKAVPVVTIARLGREPAQRILLKAVLVSTMKGAYLKRVVRGSVKSNQIPVLSPGAVQTVTLPEIAVDTSLQNRLIVYVTDEDETRVYQCESIAVP